MQTSKDELEFVGIDIFVICPTGLPELPKSFEGFELTDISERGMKVWPGNTPKEFLTNWFRCRYTLKTNLSEPDSIILKLLKEIKSPLKWEKVQKLFKDQGQNKFSKAYEA